MHTQMQVENVAGLSAEAVEALRAKGVLRTVLSYNDGAGNLARMHMRILVRTQALCLLCVNVHTHIDRQIEESHAIEFPTINQGALMPSCVYPTINQGALMPSCIYAHMCA
jgi:hypothetical protein